MQGMLSPGTERLRREDVLRLLDVDVYSREFYELLSEAESYARRTFRRGYVFCQIGVDSNPCPGNCAICSMAKDHFCVEKRFTRSPEEAAEEIVKAYTPQVSDLFLMTTECYDREVFLEVIRKARAIRRACL